MQRNNLTAVRRGHAGAVPCTASGRVLPMLATFAVLPASQPLDLSHSKQRAHLGAGAALQQCLEGEAAAALQLDDVRAAGLVSGRVEEARDKERRPLGHGGRLRRRLPVGGQRQQEQQLRLHRCPHPLHSAATYPDIQLGPCRGQLLAVKALTDLVVVSHAVHELKLPHVRHLTNWKRRASGSAVLTIRPRQIAATELKHTGWAFAARQGAESASHQDLTNSSGLYTTQRLRYRSAACAMRHTYNGAKPPDNSLGSECGHLSNDNRSGHCMVQHQRRSQSVAPKKNLTQTQVQYTNDIR